MVVFISPDSSGILFGGVHHKRYTYGENSFLF
jgi:hypothetical protein